jgi:hypothetical protein
MLKPPNRLVLNGCGFGVIPALETAERVGDKVCSDRDRREEGAPCRSDG